MQFISLKDIQFVKISGKIVNPIDLQQIKKKAESHASFYDFRTDILWFIHNCCIQYGGDVDVQTAIGSLKKYVDEEIDSVIDCAQCFLNAYKHATDGFIMVCQPPHPIVWAQSSGFGFWPAKAMRGNDNLLRVRYFGDHTNDVVPFEKCYKYSTEPPLKVLYSDNLHTLALNVMHKFIFITHFI